MFTASETLQYRGAFVGDLVDEERKLSFHTSGR
jgi:hypothetical protein